MAYQKQTFKDNETVLKAEHLNHIEDGIVALENTMNDSKGVFIPNGAKVGQIIQVSAVDEIGQPTEWEATDLPEGVSDYTELENKPSINGVELSGNQTSADLGIGDPTDEQVATAVDAWLDAHPEATTTVADGSISTAKLADGAVTPDKLQGATYEKWQVFDPAEFLAGVQVGYYMNGTTGGVNSVGGDTRYRVSPFMEADCDTYTMIIPFYNADGVLMSKNYDRVTELYCYDAEQIFLGKATGIQLSNDGTAVIYQYTTLEGTCYIRFNAQGINYANAWTDGYIDGIMLCKGDEIYDDYFIGKITIWDKVDYGASSRDNSIPGSKLKDNTVSGEKLQDQSIDRKKIVEVSPESIVGCDFINLFDKNLYDLAGGVSTFYIRGGWVNTNGKLSDAGNVLSAWVTLFIPCYPNKTYSLYRLSDTGEVLTDWYGPRVAFWDEAGENPISVITNDLTSFTTPDGAYFICVTLKVNDAVNQQKYINRIMLVEGSTTVSSYYPYAVSPYWINTNKTLLGASVICYGDSLTQNKYPSKLADILGVSVTDAGVGGNTCASIAARVGNYGTGYDVVTLMVGTNDQGGQTSCPLGTADDEVATDDNATNAETTYASRLKRLLNKIKATHRGATFVIMPPFEHAWSSYEGLAILMEEIARKYKMPYLDIYHLCGWDGRDAEDKAIFMADDTHENDVGAQRIAELLAGFIKQLKGA